MTISEQNMRKAEQLATLASGDSAFLDSEGNILGAEQIASALQARTDQAEKLADALKKIAETKHRIYDGNRPYISDHDSGYAQGIAAGHQLAANWANEALADYARSKLPVE